MYVRQQPQQWWSKAWMSCGKLTFLNPNQIPVITVDRPLSALAKMFQWKWPASHGEHAFVVILGGLHIDMALWSVLGVLLDGSCWTTTLIDAEVVLFGFADSFLKATYLTRTRFEGNANKKRNFWHYNYFSFWAGHKKDWCVQCLQLSQ